MPFVLHYEGFLGFLIGTIALTCGGTSKISKYANFRVNPYLKRCSVCQFQDVLVGFYGEYSIFLIWVPLLGNGYCNICRIVRIDVHVYSIDSTITSQAGDVFAI